MTREEHIRSLLSEYSDIRARNRADADARLREAIARDAQIGRLRERAPESVLGAMRAFMRTQREDERRAIAEQMRESGLSLNREIRARLKLLGLPEDHLDERYRCEICHDTGYTSEIPAKFCVCFENALRMRQFEDGTMAGLEEQNFAAYDEELVRRANPDPELFKRLIAAKMYSERYADLFPQNERPNIVFSGPGGVGKTFLLNAIYARIVERGQSGIRVTAYRMHETMRKKHMGTEADARSFEELIEAPILLIDDLGTEPMLRNITVEYLFTLLNERCAQKMHTVIATNLSPAQIKDRYGERVSSRMLDGARCALIRLAGSDLRIK
ncbi:MAG: ATP-binding protein [Christensenellales bacterium]